MCACLEVMLLMLSLFSSLDTDRTAHGGEKKHKCPSRYRLHQRQKEKLVANTAIVDERLARFDPFDQLPQPTPF